MQEALPSLVQLLSKPWMDLNASFRLDLEIFAIENLWFLNFLVGSPLSIPPLASMNLRHAIVKHICSGTMQEALPVKSEVVRS